MVYVTRTIICLSTHLLFLSIGYLLAKEFQRHKDQRREPMKHEDIHQPKTQAACLDVRKFCWTNDSDGNHKRKDFEELCFYVCTSKQLPYFLIFICAEHTESGHAPNKRNFLSNLSEKKGSFTVIETFLSPCENVPVTLQNDISQLRTVVRHKVPLPLITRKNEFPRTYFKELHRPRELPNCSDVPFKGRFSINDESSRSSDIGKSSYFCENCFFVCSEEIKVVTNTVLFFNQFMRKGDVGSSNKRSANDMGVTKCESFKECVILLKNEITLQRSEELSNYVNIKHVNNNHEKLNELYNNHPENFPLEEELSYVSGSDKMPKISPHKIKTIDAYSYLSKSIKNIPKMNPPIKLNETVLPIKSNSYRNNKTISPKTSLNSKLRKHVPQNDFTQKASIFYDTKSPYVNKKPDVQSTPIRNVRNISGKNLKTELSASNFSSIPINSFKTKSTEVFQLNNDTDVEKNAVVQAVSPLHYSQSRVPDMDKSNLKQNENIEAFNKQIDFSPITYEDSESDVLDEIDDFNFEAILGNESHNLTDNSSVESSFIAPTSESGEPANAYQLTNLSKLLDRKEITVTGHSIITESNISLADQSPQNVVTKSDSYSLTTKSEDYFSTLKLNHSREEKENVRNINSSVESTTNTLNHNRLKNFKNYDERNSAADISKVEDQSPLSLQNPSISTKDFAVNDKILEISAINNYFDFAEDKKSVEKHSDTFTAARESTDGFTDLSDIPTNTPITKNKLGEQDDSFIETEDSVLRRNSGNDDSSERNFFINDVQSEIYEASPKLVTTTVQTSSKAYVDEYLDIDTISSQDLYSTLNLPTSDMTDPSSRTLSSDTVERLSKVTSIKLEDVASDDSIFTSTKLLTTSKESIKSDTKKDEDSTQYRSEFGEKHIKGTDKIVSLTTFDRISYATPTVGEVINSRKNEMPSQKQELILTDSTTNKNILTNTEIETLELSRKDMEKVTENIKGITPSELESSKRLLQTELSVEKNTFYDRNTFNDSLAENKLTINKENVFTFSDDNALMLIDVSESPPIRNDKTHLQSNEFEDQTSVTSNAEIRFNNRISEKHPYEKNSEYATENKKFSTENAFNKHNMGVTFQDRRIGEDVTASTPNQNIFKSTKMSKHITGSDINGMSLSGNEISSSTNTHAHPYEKNNVTPDTSSEKQVINTYVDNISTKENGATTEKQKHINLLYETSPIDENILTSKMDTLPPEKGVKGSITEKHTTEFVINSLSTDLSTEKHELLDKSKDEILIQIDQDIISTKENDVFFHDENHISDNDKLSYITENVEQSGINDISQSTTDSESISEKTTDTFRTEYESLLPRESENKILTHTLTDDILIQTDKDMSSTNKNSNFLITENTESSTINKIYKPSKEISTPFTEKQKTTDEKESDFLRDSSTQKDKSLETSRDDIFKGIDRITFSTSENNVSSHDKSEIHNKSSFNTESIMTSRMNATFFSGEETKTHGTSTATNVYDTDATEDSSSDNVKSNNKPKDKILISTAKEILSTSKNDSYPQEIENININYETSINGNVISPTMKATTSLTDRNPDDSYMNVTSINYENNLLLTNSSNENNKSINISSDKNLDRTDRDIFLTTPDTNFFETTTHRNESHLLSDLSTENDTFLDASSDKISFRTDRDVFSTNQIDASLEGEKDINIGDESPSIKGNIEPSLSNEIFHPYTDIKISVTDKHTTTDMKESPLSKGVSTENDKFFDVSSDKILMRTDKDVFSTNQNDAPFHEKKDINHNDKFSFITENIELSSSNEILHPYTQKESSVTDKLTTTNVVTGQFSRDLSTESDKFFDASSDKIRTDRDTFTTNQNDAPPQEKKDINLNGESPTITENIEPSSSNENFHPYADSKNSITDKLTTMHMKGGFLSKDLSTEIDKYFDASSDNILIRTDRDIFSTNQNDAPPQEKKDIKINGESPTITENIEPSSSNENLPLYTDSKNSTTDKLTTMHMKGGFLSKDLSTEIDKYFDASSDKILIRTDRDIFSTNQNDAHPQEKKDIKINGESPTVTENIEPSSSNENLHLYTDSKNSITDKLTTMHMKGGLLSKDLSTENDKYFDASSDKILIRTDRDVFATNQNDASLQEKRDIILNDEFASITENIESSSWKGILHPYSEVRSSDMEKLTTTNVKESPSLNDLSTENDKFFEASSDKILIKTDRDVFPINQNDTPLQGKKDINLNDVSSSITEYVEPSSSNEILHPFTEVKNSVTDKRTTIHMKGGLFSKDLSTENDKFFETSSDKILIRTDRDIFSTNQNDDPPQEKKDINLNAESPTITENIEPSSPNENLHPYTDSKNSVTDKLTTADAKEGILSKDLSTENDKLFDSSSDKILIRTDRDVFSTNQDDSPLPEKKDINPNDKSSFITENIEPSNLNDVQQPYTEVRSFFTDKFATENVKVLLSTVLSTENKNFLDETSDEILTRTDKDIFSTNQNDALFQDENHISFNYNLDFGTKSLELSSVKDIFLPEKEIQTSVIDVLRNNDDKESVKDPTSHDDKSTDASNDKILIRTDRDIFSTNGNDESFKDETNVKLDYKPLITTENISPYSMSSISVSGIENRNSVSTNLTVSHDRESISPLSTSPENDKSTDVSNDNIYTGTNRNIFSTNANDATFKNVNYNNIADESLPVTESVLIHINGISQPETTSITEGRTSGYTINGDTLSKDDSTQNNKFIDIPIDSTLVQTSIFTTNQNDERILDEKSINDNSLTFTENLLSPSINYVTDRFGYEKDYISTGDTSIQHDTSEDVSSDQILIRTDRDISSTDENDPTYQNKKESNFKDKSLPFTENMFLSSISVSSIPDEELGRTFTSRFVTGHKQEESNNRDLSNKNGDAKSTGTPSEDFVPDTNTYVYSSPEYDSPLKNKEQNGVNDEIASFTKDSLLTKVSDPFLLTDEIGHTNVNKVTNKIDDVLSTDKSISNPKDKDTDISSEKVLIRTDRDVFSSNDEGLFTSNNEDTFSSYDRGIFTANNGGMLTSGDEGMLSFTDEDLFSSNNEGLFSANDDVLSEKGDKLLPTSETITKFNVEKEISSSGTDKYTLMTQPENNLLDDAIVDATIKQLSSTDEYVTQNENSKTYPGAVFGGDSAISGTVTDPLQNEDKIISELETTLPKTNYISFTPVSTKLNLSIDSNIQVSISANTETPTFSSDKESSSEIVASEREREDKTVDPSIITEKTSTLSSTVHSSYGYSVLAIDEISTANIDPTEYINPTKKEFLTSNIDSTISQNDFSVNENGINEKTTNSIKISTELETASLIPDYGTSVTENYEIASTVGKQDLNLISTSGIITPNEGDELSTDNTAINSRAGLDEITSTKISTEEMFSKVKTVSSSIDYVNTVLVDTEINTNTGTTTQNVISSTKEILTSNFDDEIFPDDVTASKSSVGDKNTTPLDNKQKHITEMEKYTSSIAYDFSPSVTEDKDLTREEENQNFIPTDKDILTTSVSKSFSKEFSSNYNDETTYVGNKLIGTEKQIILTSEDSNLPSDTESLYETNQEDEITESINEIARTEGQLSSSENNNLETDSLIKMDQEGEITESINEITRTEGQLLSTGENINVLSSSLGEITDSIKDIARTENELFSSSENTNLISASMGKTEQEDEITESVNEIDRTEREFLSSSENSDLPSAILPLDGNDQENEKTESINEIVRTERQLLSSSEGSSLFASYSSLEGRANDVEATDPNEEHIRTEREIALSSLDTEPSLVGLDQNKEMTGESGISSSANANVNINVDISTEFNVKTPLNNSNPNVNSEPPVNDETTLDEVNIPTEIMPRKNDETNTNRELSSSVTTEMSTVKSKTEEYSSKKETDAIVSKTFSTTVPKLDTKDKTNNYKSTTETAKKNSISSKVTTTLPTSSSTQAIKSTTSSTTTPKQSPATTNDAKVKSIPTSTDSSTRSITTQNQPKTSKISSLVEKISTDADYVTISTAEVSSIPFHFTIDANYDEVVGSRKKEFEKSLTKQLVIVMRIPYESLQNLQVSKGSIEVNFELVPSSEHGHMADEKALKAAADELKRMIDNGQLNINDLDENTLVVIPIDPPTKAPVVNQTEHTTLILGVVIGAFILTVISVAIAAIIIKRKANGIQRLSPIEEARSKLPSYREIPFQEALFMKGPSKNQLMFGKYCYDTGKWLGPGPEPIASQAPESVVYRPPTDSEIRQTPRPPTAVRERLKSDWELDWDTMVFSR